MLILQTSSNIPNTSYDHPTIPKHPYTRWCLNIAFELGRPLPTFVNLSSANPAEGPGCISRRRRNSWVSWHRPFRGRLFDETGHPFRGGQRSGPPVGMLSVATTIGCVVSDQMS